MSYKKTKNPVATAEQPAAKKAQKRGLLGVAAAFNTTSGVGKPPNHPSGPNPGHTPTYLYKEPAQLSKQGELFVLASFCCGRGPMKPCLNLLSGL